MGAIPDFETAMTIIRDLEAQVAADDLARLDWSMSKETIRCLKEDFAVAEAQVVVLKEALKIACADAWPNQPQWPALYEGRAAENIQTAPRRIGNGSNS
jgi:hypothetical protein